MAPSASARYSRRRDMASLIIWANSGERIISTMASTAKITLPSPPPSRPRPRPPMPPPNQNQRSMKSAIRTTAPTSVATIVPSRMSRSRTCDISCATTPSSSTRFIMSSSPCVTAIEECSGSRPVANALGACSGTTYTVGFGKPAPMARLSTMLCSRGSSCGVTARARAVRRTS